MGMMPFRCLWEDFLSFYLSLSLFLSLSLPLSDIVFSAELKKPFNDECTADFAVFSETKWAPLLLRTLSTLSLKPSPKDGRSLV